MSKQRAELRVVLYDGKHHGLYWRATLAGYDIYASPEGKGKGQIFRTSYHKTGVAYTYVFRKRVNKLAQPVPKSLTGKVKIGTWSHSLNTIPMDNPLQQDTDTRRSLVLDMRDLSETPPFTVELWAIEPGNDTLISGLLAEYSSNAQLVLGNLLTEWTRPLLFVCVWTLSPKAWAALGRSIEASESHQGRAQFRATRADAEPVPPWEWRVRRKR